MMASLRWYWSRFSARAYSMDPSPAIRVSDDDDMSVTAYRRVTIAIFLIAIALRLLRAQLPDDTTYPDDVYQILEPAHRLVFGYGYIAWEFVTGIRNWLFARIVDADLGWSR